MDKNKKAITLMKENQFEEAAALFSEVIEEEPNNPLGFINFGNLLLHVKDYNRAQRFFERAIEIDSNAATAYYGLGNLYFEESIYPRAQENFQKAIELGLEEGDVYYMLGMTLQKQEQFKLSLPYLLRATELAEKDEEILFQYGLSLAQSDNIIDAKTVFEKVLGINSEHSDAHYNLGVIALFHDDSHTALMHFEEALRSQPDHLLAANGKKNVEKLYNDIGK